MRLPGLVRSVDRRKRKSNLARIAGPQESARRFHEAAQRCRDEPVMNNVS